MKKLKDNYKDSCLSINFQKVYNIIKEKDCSLRDIINKVPDIDMNMLYDILWTLENEQEIVHDVEQDIFGISIYNF